MDAMMNRRLWLLFSLAVCSIFCVTSGDGLGAKSSANAQNVALFRRTFQSSDNNSLTTPDLAVDDNDTTCSVTGRQKKSNWTVVLDDILPISQIRMNLGGEFFGPNVEVFVSNIVSHELGFLCYYGSGESTSDSVNFSCFSGPLMARTVTVRNTFTGYVRLCDFQVFVCNDGFFGVECTKQCRCDGDSLCNKTNGACPGLCAPGWNGIDCQSACADGFLGPNCQRICHCSNNSFCDKQTDDCPAGCAIGWVGPGCRTEIPQLMTPPTMYRADVTQITIIWHSWIRFVDPSITLFYKIRFKLTSSSDIGKNQSWIETPLQADTDHFNENKTVTGLQRNSFYIFLVVPVLRISSTEMIEGGASPQSNPFRTKCTVPETPNITKAYSWLDTSRHVPAAVLTIEWMPLTQKQSNCENILYYEIFYQKRGFDWRSMGAKRMEHAKNISSDISFESEYLVRVVAHNNHPYQSSSETRIIRTPRAPEFSYNAARGYNCVCNPECPLYNDLQKCYVDSSSMKLGCGIGNGIQSVVIVILIAVVVMLSVLLKRKRTENPRADGEATELDVYTGLSNRTRPANAEDHPESVYTSIIPPEQRQDRDYANVD